MRLRDHSKHGRRLLRALVGILVVLAIGYVLFYTADGSTLTQRLQATGIVAIPTAWLYDRVDRWLFRKYGPPTT